MPIHLPTASRRQFLTQSAAALASLSILRVGYAASSAEPLTLALLSDTHIPENAEISARDVNMTANLQSAVQQINQLSSKPTAVLFNGDCAYLKGLPADYANFANCIQPLLDAEQDLHMTMGNHDNIPAFYHALKAQQPEQPLVESKHVSILETPYANFFLLDSLFKTNVVTGELGAAQRNWLSDALDARADKPAIIIAHHPLQKVAPPEGKPWGGIVDTADFLALMHAKKHVKAFVFGHSHVWSHTKDGDLNLINLPACAYVFSPDQPNGWTLARLHQSGIEFELQAHDKNHPQHQQKFAVAW